ncbi:MAG: hypothetical protein HZB70_03295 [Candidatus Berkelbacteria bacterium]|nr:MAG: hypothetical protein HZB70_03295 [Candidatus Berkelbacteria bacterium]QQG51673.1 MAG: hypothetical protein HY845_03895 [Candidatus Berkelbacteria bacterium]
MNRFLNALAVFGAVGLIALNTWYLNNPVLGIFGLFAYCFILSRHFGARLGLGSNLGQNLVGLLFLLASLALFGAVLIAGAALTKSLTIAALAALGLFSLAPPIKTVAVATEATPTEDDDQLLPPLFSRISFAVFVGSVLGMVIILLFLRNGDYYYRYWDILPIKYWVTAAVALVSFACVLVGKLPPKLKLLSIVAFGLVIHGTILMLARTEYDGDGYRHLSIERYLTTELPLYQLTALTLTDIIYLGSWALNVMVSWLTQVPIDIVHNYLPWLSVSVFPPVLLYLAGQEVWKRRLPALLMAVAPLFFYEVTVHGMISNPKSLGYILLIFNILLALRTINSPRLIWLPGAIVAFSSLMTYPLTGLFSLMVFLLSLFSRWRFSLGRNLFFIIICLAGAAAFPYLDWQTGSNFPFTDWVDMSVQLLAKWASVILLTGRQISFPLLLYFLVGLGLFRLYAQPSTRRYVPLLLLPLIATHLAYAWRLSLPIQPAFTARIYISLAVFLMPFIAGGIASLSDSAGVLLGKARGSLIVLALVPLFVAATHAISPTTWSISTREIEAIKAIDEENPDRSYVVLTEEITSAAANAVLGYTVAPYYRYPTGDLFQFSSEISLRPSIDTLERARRHFNVRKVYVITNPLPPFNDQVARKRFEQILPVHLNYDNRVFVFRYPGPVVEPRESDKETP